MITCAFIEQKVRAALEVDHLEVEDLRGTGDVFRVLVVSKSFEGQNRVKRHRMIYGLFAEEMKGAIHALQLETVTPGEL